MAEQVSHAEMARQREISASLRDAWQGKRYHIVTYGCQMNAHESEVYAGILEEMGMEAAPTRWEADFLLFNTCCIRENAEKRLFGNIGKLREHKQENRPGLMIGVCGCVPQQEGVARRLMRRYPFVDFVMGAQGGHTLPETVQRAMEGRMDAVVEDERVAEGQPVRRLDPFRAYVNIMYGCDNFCTYCIVPYVRGRERSRAAGEVIAEVEVLAKDGVQEITLLGQNVNSFSGGMSFTKLLRELNGVVPRIRFMTSHPKDITDDVLDAAAECGSVAKHIHLPAQSGSDAVLAAMNRGYTRERYLGIVRRARERMPGVGISTDIIVGFPGETEDDFLRTLDLMQAARFDSAFTFAYSARKGTGAATFEGQISEEIKKERLHRLIELQEEIQQEVYRGLVGYCDTLLVEGPSKKGDGVTGRIGRGIMVNTAQSAQTGSLMPVRITQPKHKTLYAEWGEPS